MMLVASKLLVRNPQKVVYTLLIFVKNHAPQCADATGFEQKRRPVLQRLASPSHGQGTQDVPMRHDQHVALDILFLGLSNGGLVPFFADLANQAV